MSELNIHDMTKKDFLSLPHRKWDEEIIFNSLIIIPGLAKDLHDSGYRCLDFVAVRGITPICLLAGGSDVIHVDGIGGFGKDWLKKYNRRPATIPPSGWSIDCLPKSGLLRMWPESGRMTCGASISSFEIFALSKDEKASGVGR